MKKVIVATVLFFGMLTLLSFRQGFNLKASMDRGKDLYNSKCITCHMEDGKGLEGVYPTLIKSDYFKDRNRTIKNVLLGSRGEMVVNGITYTGEMPGLPLTDQEVSDILNYVLNSWGNKAAPILPQAVQPALKSETPGFIKY
jgi:mono/diheme cytochrome c family protein